MNEATPGVTSVPVEIPSDFASDEDIELIAWRVDNGSQVESGDVVAEVATAKAEIEVEASAGGVLRQKASAGDLLQPGDVIGAIEHG